MKHKAVRSINGQTNRQIKELNLPFYDPFMIVEKTGGRLEGDNYRIEIIRRKV